MLIDAGKDLIASLGFDRATPVHSNECTESEAIVLNQVKYLNVDLVYFNTDENGSSYPAIFLKEVSTFDSGTLSEIAEIQKNIWNYRKVLFLYVFSDTEIRIYNCAGKPIIKAQQTDYEIELKELEIGKYSLTNKQHLEELNKIFSRVAIDTGIVWTLEEAEKIRKKIDLQRRVDRYLVDSLVETTKQLEADGLSKDLIHTLILRSLFLLYLEDRGATDDSFYQQINKNATCYFDILKNVKDTYHLYQKLEKHFNGNVFTVKADEMKLVTKEQLDIIRKCFISGNEDTAQVDLFSEWRIFDFSIIQIELLSEIYERFLLESNPEQKKQSGTFYTPPALVEFILNEKLPITKSHTNYNVKILDPSCGSGIFLVESFKRLVKRYENHHGKKLNDFNKLKKLLTENIFGIEIEPQSIKVATFSLYLALVDCLDPKTIWQEENHLLPNLINDPNDDTLKVQGHNLFCRDTIEVNKEVESHSFDLIVGNPPFGTRGLSTSIRKYCEKYNFAKEMVLPFLHKAVSLAPNGEVALIFNTKVLTNTGSTYQNFRKWLFNECYVEKVFNFSIFRKVPKSFGGHLFGNAIGPISIVYYQSQIPESPSTQIEYIAPKTYVKSNVIDGLQIDTIDIKYLPREECQKPNSKIWKIAMWGGLADWKLIENLTARTSSIKEFLKNPNNEWEEPKVGLHGEQSHSNFTPEKVINTRYIERYYTPESASEPNVKEFRSINKAIFKPPFVIMKKGQHKKRLTASYIDYFSYCTTACYVFNGNVTKQDKKTLVCILNSKVMKYLLFLTSSSWGIEREQIFMDEILESPALMPLLSNETLLLIESKFDEIKSLKSDFHLVNGKISEIEQEIDSILVSDIFVNSEEAVLTISDNLTYSLDLFDKQSQSIALKSVQQNQIEDYSKAIVDNLNAFIEGQNLYVNATVFDINQYSPLMMVKLSFSKEKETIKVSDENVSDQLNHLDKKLWEEKASNIYVRKILNYKSDDDIFIIRPNQRRFWSKSMAMEDGSNLILEILNGV